MITAATFLGALLAREVVRQDRSRRPGLAAALDRVVVSTGIACLLLVGVRFVALVVAGA